MTATNKKNGVEHVGRGRDRLDHLEMLITCASDWSEAFCFPQEAGRC